MGACILCGKSAGFFYALHKKCFQKYNSSDQILAQYIYSNLSKKSSHHIATVLQEQVRQYGFVPEASHRTLVRSLEKFATEYLEDKAATIDYAQWLTLIRHLGLDESLFINPNFIAQQENFPCVQSLQQGVLPGPNCSAANFSVQLLGGEEVRWCFDRSYIEEISYVQSSAKWSVVKQLVENILPERRNKELMKKTKSEQGKIWLTNKRLFFEDSHGAQSINLSDLYSCTPAKNGVCVQLKNAQAMPRIYICEDGRLLYQFLYYYNTVNSLSA